MPNDSLQYSLIQFHDLMLPSISLPFDDLLVIDDQKTAICDKYMDVYKQDNFLDEEELV